MGGTIDRQGRVINILDPQNTGSDTAVSVNADTPAVSQAVFLPAGCTYGWLVQFSSGGVVDVRIDIQQRFRRADSFLIPDNKQASPMFLSIQDEEEHMTAYAPVAGMEARLLITGTASNDATTQLVKALVYVVKN